jgi:hypothetical protein
MLSTLRTLTILFTAVILVQCSEEELLPAKDQAQIDQLKASKTSHNAVNAFTIGATPLHDYDSEVPGYDFQFYMKGSGSITIHWGDGSSTAHQFTDSWDTFTHGYATSSEYTIAITGDIKNITYFDTYYGMGAFNAINFKRLSALEEISIGLTESSSTIDLSHNTKLKFVSLAGMQQLERLILPKRHNINQINLDGPFKFDTEDIDGIIDNIYANTVAKNIMGGRITLYREWYQEEGDMGMVGPPSAAAIEKLNKLKNIYGWEVTPSLDSPNM